MACAQQKKLQILKRLFRLKYLISFGERGGTRTIDPMIKTHVLKSAGSSLMRV
jgi:hypothetical protein